MQNVLMNQALELLVFGMGTVFVFLSILVISINIMSRFMQTFFPDPVAIEAHPEFTQRHKEDEIINHNTMDAIQAAIHLHRAKHARD